MTILHHTPVEFRQLIHASELTWGHFEQPRKFECKCILSHNFPPDELWASYSPSLLSDSPSTTLVKYPVRGRGGANFSRVIAVSSVKPRVPRVLWSWQRVQCPPCVPWAPHGPGLVRNLSILQFSVKWWTFKLKATTKENLADTLLTPTFRLNYYLANANFLRLYFNIL